MMLWCNLVSKSFEEQTVQNFFFIIYLIRLFKKMNSKKTIQLSIFSIDLDAITTLNKIK